MPEYTTATLWPDDCRPDALPQVCAMCGRDATGEKEIIFTWRPPWVGVTILLSPIVYAAFASTLTRQRAAHLPICDRHRGLGERGAGPSLAVLALFFVALATGLGAAGLAGRNDLAAPVLLGSFALLAIGLVAVAALPPRGPRPTLITDDELRLEKLAPEFVEALEALQDRQDEYEAWRVARRAERRRHDAD